MLLITLRYGLRVGELVGLQQSDIVDGKITIRREKGSNTGAYSVSNDIAAALGEYGKGRIDNATNVFTGRFGALTTRFAQLMFKRIAAAAGIKDNSIHCLRHTCAVLMLDAGLDLADVQDQLGHKSIQSTLVYAAVSNKRRTAYEKVNFLNLEEK